MNDRNNAADFLTHYLPDDILNLINPNDILIRKDSFVDPEFREFFSDIVYETQIEDRTGYIYFLFEHKSYPDQLTVLQLLRYMLNLWRQHAIKENMGLFPVIIPIVVYHGSRPWNAPMRLSELVQVRSDSLRKYLPDFTYELRDLTAMEDERIVGWAGLRTGLLLLKYSHDPDVRKHLRRILELLFGIQDERKQEAFLKMVVSYIMSGIHGVSMGEIKEIVETTISPEAGGHIMTIAEKLIREGKKEGLLEGLQKGKLEGLQEGLQKGKLEGLLEGKVEAKRAAVLQILEARFGAIPLKIVERIGSITNPTVLDSLLSSTVKTDSLEAFSRLLEEY